MAAVVATAGMVLSCLLFVFCGWPEVSGVTLRRLWGVAHLLPGIDQIHAGAKHLHQLFLIVRDVPLHDVHAGSQQPLERLHIHNCIVRKRWGREWVLHTSKSKSLPSCKPFLNTSIPVLIIQEIFLNLQFKDIQSVTICLLPFTSPFFSPQNGKKKKYLQRFTN